TASDAPSSAVIRQPLTGIPPGALAYHSPDSPRARHACSASAATSSIGASATQSNVNSSVIYRSPLENRTYAVARQTVGLEGCKSSNHPSVSRAAEATPPPHGKREILGRRPEGTRPPQTPPA